MTLILGGGYVSDENDNRRLGGVVTSGGGDGDRKDKKVEVEVDLDVLWGGRWVELVWPKMCECGRLGEGGRGRW